MITPVRFASLLHQSIPIPMSWIENTYISLSWTLIWSNGRTTTWGRARSYSWEDNPLRSSFGTEFSLMASIADGFNYLKDTNEND